ncbi:outer membrane beta-barrel protein [candidate division GN15 bacterium]|nr:outer membrane beta-barrel protein [candidate division GN15 bacterium]
MVDRIGRALVTTGKEARIATCGETGGSVSTPATTAARTRTSARIVVILAVFATLIVTASADAQPTAFGIKAGLSISNQDYDYEEGGPIDVERESRTGLALSFFAEFPITPILSLQPELAYVQRGSKLFVSRVPETGPPAVETGELDDRIDYLVIPLHLRVRLPGATYRPYALLGPRLDFKINDRSESASVLAGDLETINYGLSLGLGLEYGAGPIGAVFTELGYQFDFSKTVDTELLDVSSQSFLFLIGYTF